MKQRLVILFTFATVLFTACVKEVYVVDPVPGQSSAPLISIDGSINQIQTKANVNGFQDGDGVGLYAVNYSQNNTVAGTMSVKDNQADNVKYIFNYEHNSWNSVRPVYYKDVNTNVDIYCYYPYQGSIDSINDFTFQVQADQSSDRVDSVLGGYEASDFLWGKTAGVRPTESSISVRLGHILSAVQVNLVEGSGFAAGEFDLLNKVVMVMNTSRKASIDLSTGFVNVVGSPQSTGIVMAPQGNDSFRAVVVPQNVNAGLSVFSITIGSVTHTFRMSDTIVEYLAGKQSSFTINVDKKSVTGEVELSLTSSSIIEWVEDRNTHGGEAKQYYVVNVSQPGLLGKTIKDDNKNPDKIKNLKVTGSVNHRDFEFMRDSMAILEAINMKEASLRCFDHNDPKGTAINANIPGSAFRHKTSLYYFVFPEVVEYIGESAFEGTSISGHLVIPDDVKAIEHDAFAGCSNLTGLSLNDKLETIGYRAFEHCASMTGSLDLPHELRTIEYDVFSGCIFRGLLHLPDNLESIGDYAFAWNLFEGDLVIPGKVSEIGYGAFLNCNFNGHLDISKMTHLSPSCFGSNKFIGELVIPEGIEVIPDYCFEFNHFSSIVLSSSLKSIGRLAFWNMDNISEICLPEGLLTIQEQAFAECNSLQSIIFPSSLISIGSRAFEKCMNVSSITCTATQVPNVLENAFDGVPKDNFTLEVPESMVTQYQAAPGWGDFKRVSGHYDFSISRSIMRGLNTSTSNSYTLRAPSGFKWSIESKPDWVTVSPDHGTGKTELTISFSDMPHDYGQFNVANSEWPYTDFVYDGRSGEIVFLLNDKDYRSSMTVEQYDYEYQDGSPIQLQTASKGNGIDIIYIGDGYDAKDIATGKFLSDIKEGNKAFFGVEPYATYKDYFNVSAVVSLSKDSGIGTVNTVKDVKFGSYISQNRLLAPDPDACFTWANRAKSGIDFSRSLVVMLQNTSVYEGVTMMFGDGSAIACCPVSTEAYPYDFRGIIQHEAGGHGFGKLADEYIYHNAFIQNCDCLDGCEHPHSDLDLDTQYGLGKLRGWYCNVSMEPDMKNVPWAHLIFNSKYSDYVDMFEGAFMHSRGIFRSEAVSCMNNNIPYFSAISRQAIVERIMTYSGEPFDFDTFVSKDSRSFGAATKASLKTAVPTEYIQDYRERTMPMYMGEKPRINR